MIRLAEKIRQIRADIPIILCTGFSGDLSLLHSDASAVDEIILKPYDIDRLANIIRKLIDQARAVPDWDI